MKEQVKNKTNEQEIIVKITSTKGTCLAGHKVNDKFKVAVVDTGGLCGSAYYTIYPMILALTCGGKIPGGGMFVETCCPDYKNLVTFQISQREVAK